MNFDNKIVAVPIIATTTIDKGSAEVLFDTSVHPFFTRGYTGFQYDVTGDGKRFIVISSANQVPLARLSVIVNWTQLIGR